jgi:long-chain acyl-CoA synthetase
MSGPIHTAPPDAGSAVLGKTLPELLYDACDRYENPQALNQPTDEGWEPLSLDRFRVQTEETAIGLLQVEEGRGRDAHDERAREIEGHGKRRSSG